jgi:hypothetical protein
MARRKKKISIENKLVELLKAGKTINGLEGFVKISGCCGRGGEDGAVYAKAKIVGVEPSEEGSGLKVIAQILSGRGEICVDPADWKDTLEEVESTVELDKLLDKCVSERSSILSCYLQRQRRAALQKYCETNLSPEQLSEIEEDLKEHQMSWTKMTDSELKTLSRAAVCMANGVSQEQAQRRYDLQNDHSF